ncbi:MAG: hypothetical protein NC122_09505 [Faecalibacterium sp.]|nr:hypothetical protein [Ruminococcus sp.]MCM1392535.1 hypothetical protein [Ruminococcus sp.]MCM1486427.1 hypothetical protein [Faecalibacterium sp.]
MSKSYIGITIGPIIETMNLVSSPAALWASSYIFSSVTKEICHLLVTEYGLDSKMIISPYYDENSGEFDRDDGVGLYHDRIIFVKPDDFDIKRINDIKTKVIVHLMDTFFADVQGKAFNDSLPRNEVKEYLEHYIMITAVAFSNEEESQNESFNPILKSGKILDCMELAKPFVPTENENYILKRFTGSKETSKNDLIKAVVKDKLEIKNWQLIDPVTKNIKDIPSIAAVDKPSETDNTDNSDESDKAKKKTARKKYNDYCVIVRADGDNIGQIISNISVKSNKDADVDEKIREFSKKCFVYCSKAAQLVKDYGGITIYSGGDDLLAILPCKSKDRNKTVMDFALELSNEFSAIFSAEIDEIKEYNTSTTDPKKLKKVPSLSVAELIFYKSYPLYEAIERSGKLLFETAKSQKNCLAISLQKHAGQSVELIIPKPALNKIITLQKEIISDAGDKKDDVLLSALQKILLFKELFDEVKPDQMNNLFLNCFDAVAHNDNAFVHKVLPQYYNELREGECQIFATENIKGYPELFSALLRLMKFFVEKGGSV